jgi:GDP-D-mannose dehydratase
MNLVIGNTSQLSRYFPENYKKISSRNIDFNELKDERYDSVYITFAEQRIYDHNIDYITPNYFYTLKVIDSVINNSNKIVCYTSCELWNNSSGKISVNTLPNFYPLNNEYTISKLLLFNKIKQLKLNNSIYNKINFVHPFYFNSVYRSQYFLFGKIFDSIINKKKIKVKNINFYRDMVHASFVVEQSIKTTSDIVVGSGRLFNIRDFIQDLYKLNNLEFKYFVEEEDIFPLPNQKLIMADVSNNYDYHRLLCDTQNDILKLR